MVGVGRSSGGGSSSGGSSGSGGVICGSIVISISIIIICSSSISTTITTTTARRRSRYLTGMSNMVYFLSLQPQNYNDAGMLLLMVIPAVAVAVVGSSRYQ